MLHKKIETTEEAAKVAEELKNDLTIRLSCYGSYEVKSELIGEQHNISVISPRSCAIITETCLEAIHEVVDMYLLMYDYLNYHFGVEPYNDTLIPAFVVTINVSKS